MASLKDPALTFATVISAVLAAVTLALIVYRPTVPPVLWIQSNVSLAVIDVSVRVNVTAVFAANAALFIVISTTGPSFATAVALLVSCVTATTPLYAGPPYPSKVPASTRVPAVIAPPVEMKVPTFKFVPN